MKHGHHSFVSLDIVTDPGAATGPVLFEANESCSTQMYMFKPKKDGRRVLAIIHRELDKERLAA